MILLTGRLLGIAAALAGLGLLGIWVPGALDAMLLGDAALLALALADGVLAPAVGPDASAEVRPVRDTPPAFSLGHPVDI